jgi:hypothetical protein
MSKYHFLFLFLFQFCSCGPAVTFEEPQPAGKEDLSVFPASYRGNYMSKEDSSVLMIGPDYMLRTYDFISGNLLDKTDTTIVFMKDSVFNLATREGYPVQLKGDSFFVHVHEVIPLLYFKTGVYCLRKMKGHLFLNSSCGENCWSVQKLSLAKGILTIGDITSPQDIDKLNEITSSKDTVTQTYKPTKKEFRKFIKKEGFSGTEEFVKIKSQLF